jgi:GGDEF domain-containing protein
MLARQTYLDTKSNSCRRIATKCVKVSIGRANWHEHADELEALVRHADETMYEVKRIHHAALAHNGR